MAASMGQCSLFFVALFPFLVLGSEPRVSLEGVVYALEKIVGFYKNNYKHMNLDGLYGLRTLEGQFILLDTERKQGLLDHIPLSILSRIKAMEIRTAKICKEAMDFVRTDNEKYFEQMKYVVQKPWRIFKNEKKINKKLRWDPQLYKKASSKPIEESVSDECMMELFGSSTKPKCLISTKCAEIMTNKGQMEYSMTHQILWILMAEQVGCLAELNKVLLWFNFKNHEEMLLEFCSNNFFEMKHLVHSYLSGVIAPFYQDLFLEQQFVCPSIGFSEFLHLNYLKEILSWMKPNGCYGTMPLGNARNLSNFYANLKVEDYYDQDDDDDDNKIPSDIQQTIFPGMPSKTNPKLILPFLAERSPFKSPVHKSSSSSAPSLSSSSSFIRSLSNQPKDLKFVKHNILVNNQQKNQSSKVDKKAAQSDANTKLLNRLGLAPVQIQPNLMQLTMNISKQKKDTPLLNQNINKAVSYIHHHHQHDQIKHSRRLLVEKELPDECLVHKTAVAAGALSVYLNFLLHHTLGQLNHSDQIWHSVSQRLLLHTASDMKLGKKRSRILFPSERKDLDLMIPDPGAGRDPPVVKVGVQEPILGDTKLAGMSNHKDDADNDYDEYEDDKLPRENYHDKKVVHFGNNKKESLKSLDENAEDYDNESLDEDEDGDYTYYDENEEGIEKQERINKQKKLFQNTGIERKAIVPRIPHNSAFQGRSAHEGPTSFSNSSSPTGIVLVTVTFTMVLLLLLMYRFIKKRRIHIRYNPTSFLKL